MSPSSSQRRPCHSGPDHPGETSAADRAVRWRCSRLDAREGAQGARGSQAERIEVKGPLEVAAGQVWTAHGGRDFSEESMGNGVLVVQGQSLSQSFVSGSKAVIPQGLVKRPAVIGVVHGLIGATSHGDFKMVYRFVRPPFIEQSDPGVKGQFRFDGAHRLGRPLGQRVFLFRKLVREAAARHGRAAR